MLTQAHLCLVFFGCNLGNVYPAKITTFAGCNWKNPGISIHAQKIITQEQLAFSWDTPESFKIYKQSLNVALLKFILHRMNFKLKL